MFGLLKFPDDFQKSTGLKQLWYKDNHTTAHLQNNPRSGVRQQCVIQKPDPKGTFSLRVPLKHTFGFCDDYEKITFKNHVNQKQHVFLLAVLYSRL